MSPLVAHAPFHQQAEDIGSFRSFYDERERREGGASRRVVVTGPSENAD